jgi:hypothetical protein
MKIGIILIILGAVIIGYSLSIQPFTNNEEFHSQYMELEIGNSDAYFQLYEEMLSPKYRLQDTGITLIVLSVMYIVFITLGRGKVLSPGKKFTLTGIAIVLPFLSTAGFVFDLAQAMERQEYPYWADSVGIPLMGAPLQFGILMIWSILHLKLAKDAKSVPLFSAFTRNLNPWLIFVSIIAVVSLLYSVFYGQYWYAVPSAFWLYYYLSIGLSRLAPEST